VSCWRPLQWDSEQFGFRAARVELPAATGDYTAARARAAGLVETALAECRAQGIRHVTARADAGELASIHALEAAGFETIDGIQTFALALAGRSQCPPLPGLAVRLFEPAELEQVLAIARSSYMYDRFHADAALPAGVADALHETWLRNSCNGTAADAVIVAARGPTVAGYVTCKLEAIRGVIVLVATAGGARRSGVARAATEGALAWFRGRGVETVEVGTQLRNIPAARLYEGCGFRLVGVTMTLRKVL